ncbi:MAG: hypothetical protein QM778_16155 [Myxococcales bacterium]
MPLRLRGLLPSLFSTFLLGACADDSHVGPRDTGHHGDDAGARDGGEDPAELPDAAVPDAHVPADAGAQSDAASNDDAGPSEDDASAPQPTYWYDAKSAVGLSISGPLSDAFGAAFAGTPDGIIPPVRNKDPFAGGMAYINADKSARAPQVELAVRGNSSLQECVFPKLKVSFDKRVDATSDLFYDTKKVKIGTHCGEEDSVNGTIGRLRNEKAAWREEVAYQLARALGITVMQTRPAVITYTDTSQTSSFESPLTRKAFLLEHVDELARRLGATALKDPIDCGDNPDARPDATAVLRVKFFHALIGNWDWMLGPPETHGCGTLMNTEVLVHGDGSLTLVPADFDLAALVVGEVRNPDTNQVEPIEVENSAAAARAALETSLIGEDPGAVEQMKASFLAKQPELSAIVEASLMDASGKADALELLQGFFQALAKRPQNRACPCNKYQ